MRAFTLIIICAVISLIGLTDGVCSEKGSGYEYKGRPETTVESEGIAVSGKIYFSDYYSMGGKKCAAFLDGKDGGFFCILDNMTVNNLKNELGAAGGKVKVSGILNKDGTGTYIDVDGYSVIEESEHKGSH